jgi:hypothetical protein
VVSSSHLSVGGIRKHPSPLDLSFSLHDKTKLTERPPRRSLPWATRAAEKTHAGQHSPHPTLPCCRRRTPPGKARPEPAAAGHVSSPAGSCSLGGWGTPGGWMHLGRAGKATRWRMAPLSARRRRGRPRRRGTGGKSAT